MAAARLRYSRLGGVLGAALCLLGAAPPPALFTHPPAPLDAVGGVVPLGNLNPGGGHVLAVDHMYLEYVDPANGGLDTVPVYAMAAGELVLATRAERDGTPPFDYSLFIQHDGRITSQFDHLYGLSRRVRQRLDSRPGAWIEVREGFAVLFLGQLGAPEPLTLRAGERVGSTRSFSHAWDVGVTDRKVKRKFQGKGPRRYPTFRDRAAALGVALEHEPFPGHPTLNAACFLDYLAPALRAAWQAKLVSAPKGCGRPDWDLAGRLRGHWFNRAIDEAAEPPVLDLERGALSIIPDNLLPQTRIQIGIGSDGPFAALDPTGTLPQLRNAFRVDFDPTPGARRNPDPAKVRPATGIVCYDLAYESAGAARYNALLLLLGAPRRLQVFLDATAHAAPACAEALAAPAPAWTAVYVR